MEVFKEWKKNAIKLKTVWNIQTGFRCLNDNTSFNSRTIHEIQK